MTEAAAGLVAKFKYDQATTKKEKGTRPEVGVVDQ